jgi:hypothetical protein
MTTKINLSNIDSEQDYSSLATTLFAKANVAANIANTALATASTILKVTSIVYPGDDTAADTAGGQTITLTGTGFVSGASVLLNGSAVGVVSVANSTTLTFTSPSANAGSYVIYIVNPDGGTAISIPGIQYSGTPTWTTAAGSLGSLYETAAFGNTVVATGDTVTYSLQSGTLPPGATFSSNGTITGTSSTLSSPTTYTFTVRATDAQNQDTDRSFSITINPDAVTWSSPTTNTSYTLLPNVAMSNISLVATSAAGANIFYSANTLPTGVSLSGNTIFGTPTVTDETRTSLVTATANTTSESSSIILNWTISVANEAYFMYNSLLLSGDGTNNAQNNTFLDSSTNNYTITRGGTTTQGTFSPYGPNWSNYFDGTGDYLSLTGSGLGSGNFTIEMWGYFTSFPNAQNAIYNNGAADGITSCILYITSAGAVSLYNYNSAVGNSTTNVSLNTWTHIAVTRVGTTLTYYINGVASGTGTSSANISDTAVQVMRGFGGITNSPIGYISNLRTVVGTAVYTGNFTPSTTPLTAISGTSLLTCQSNRFKDNSTNNFTITRNGDVSVQRFSPFSPTAAYSAATIGGSGYFNGTTDYISIPYAGDPSTNFTIEFWWYPTTFAPNFQEIFTKGIGIQIFASGGTMTAAFAVNGAAYYLNAYFGDATLNSWNHIAVVKNSTTYTGYVNGVGTVIGTSSSVPGTQSSPVSIGYYAPTNQYWTTGYISDARYVTNIAVYTANFTPPTVPLTAITNTQLLTNFTNAGIIDNTMINNLETVGNAQISTSQSKFGGGSMYFDGAGDVVVIPASTVLAPLTGNFTYECWVYPTSSSLTYRAIFGIDNYSGTEPFRLYQYGTNFQYWYTGGANSFIGSSTITVNTWYHIAVTRSAGVIRMFVNGTQAGSNVTSTLNYPPSIFRIGMDLAGSYPFVGYIDDLRITRGYARYTTNFTPPTSALPKL